MKGTNNPAQRSGQPNAPKGESNPAMGGGRYNNKKVLKATAHAPMAYDGAPKSFDSGGKRPSNAS